MYTYSTQAVTLLAGQKNAEWLRVNCLLSVSIATLVLGLFDEGMQSGLAALSDLTQAPNRDLEANINLMLGINCQRNKNYGPAQHYLTTARDLGQTLHSQRIYAFAQCHLGDLRCDLGDYSQAKSIYEEFFTLDKIGFELDWRGWLPRAKSHS